MPIPPSNHLELCILHVAVSNSVLCCLVVPGDEPTHPPSLCWRLCPCSPLLFPPFSAESVHCHGSSVSDWQVVYPTSTGASL